jgi:hypothetical protein
MFIFVNRAIVFGLDTKFNTLKTTVEKSLIVESLWPIIPVLGDFLSEYKLTQDHLLRKFIIIAGAYPVENTRLWIDTDRICADRYR